MPSAAHGRCIAALPVRACHPSEVAEYSMNPLLDFSGLPRFAEIQPEHVTPAVDQLLAENRALLEQLASAGDAPTWDGFVAPLDDANERLSRAWGQVGASERGDEQPRAARGLQRQPAEDHPVLHRAVAGRAPVREVQGDARLGRVRSARRERRKIVDNELRDFRLGGAELPPEAEGALQGPARAARPALVTLQRQRAGRHQRLLPSGHRPGRARRHARRRAGSGRAAAAADGKQGWKFTLHMPSYLPVMQYADNRSAARTDVPRLRRRAPRSSATPSGTTRRSSPRS